MRGCSLRGGSAKKVRFISAVARHFPHQRNPDGLPNLKAPALSQLAREAWSAMTKQQQEEVTADAIKELEERREMRNLAVHNVPIAAFHDHQT